MDTETQKLIDDFVEALNNNEEKLLDFNLKVTEIYNNSQNDMENISAKLSRDFDEEKINEEEYLNLFKEEKNKILEETKNKLDNLIKSLE